MKVPTSSVRHRRCSPQYPVTKLKRVIPPTQCLNKTMAVIPADVPLDNSTIAHVLMYLDVITRISSSVSMTIFYSTCFVISVMVYKHQKEFYEVGRILLVFLRWLRHKQYDFRAALGQAQELLEDIVELWRSVKVHQE